mgnify:CR=1 FL=1
MTEQSNFQGTPQHTSPFDAIRRVDEQGNEYWSARDLYKILGYREWRNFNNTVIKRAMKACEENGRAVSDHLVRSYKVIQHGKGSTQQAIDVQLSRYGAYLTVMNGDPHLPIVAMGQEYFAEQTRRQELADQDALDILSEDQRRLFVRGQLSINNRHLAETASQAGVVTPSDFAIFQNHGYRGLYGGLVEDQIHARKQLKPTQKILDHMGSTELAANLFRATQTDEQIQREGIRDKSQANQAHHIMGQRVRQFIADGGGTMPEDLPTPEKSIQQLQREEQKRLKHNDQPDLFGNSFDENE